MTLIDVYDTPASYAVLFQILEEREPHQNISHLRMPTWQEHVAFVDSHPYTAWYLIAANGYAGTTYLSRNDEVGIFLHKEYRGIGKQVVDALRKRHPRPRYLANINPNNYGSIAFFESMGFRHIQNTYESR
jgi:RimJ/RimL family protein N-acetyltransferase